MKNYGMKTRDFFIVNSYHCLFRELDPCVLDSMDTYASIMKTRGNIRLLKS